MHQPTHQPVDRPDWLDTDVWPFAVNTFSFDGQALHYVDHGDGPVLVLVHAGLWSFIWRDLVLDLSADHRCLAIDFPGAGLSSGDPADVDLAAFGDIVNAWLDELGIDRATFVIHDLGGVVGIDAAARRPDRLVGLVAMNTFAWPPDRVALRTMLRFMGGRSATNVLGTLRTIPRMTRSRFGVGRHLDAVGRRAFFGPYASSRQRSRNFHRVIASAHRSRGLFERAQRALETTLADTPVLTVFGERNDPFGFADRWRQLFPRARSYEVASGNHFPMCDEPSMVAEQIRSWHRAEVGSRTASAVR